ncbi:hypothetical protein THIOSC15_320001 [uncultured Thiomicrorhabdus sp.]
MFGLVLRFLKFRGELFCVSKENTQGKKFIPIAITIIISPIQVN